MAEERKADGGPDRVKLLTVLVPAGGLALVIVLVAIVLAMSESSTNPSDKGKGNAGTSEPVDLSKMSDGSDPVADDPKLQPIGDQGLKYRDLKVGDGAVVPAGATVKVHYTGWLTNGTVFDSSRRRGKPIEFPLSGVVKGWQEGIPGMKVGGIRKLVIPPELGYGSKGSGEIPPNSTLIFEVELLGMR